MAKRSTFRQEETARRDDERPVADIEGLERLAIKKANRAISAIENALAVWDASEEKPEELEQRVLRLKYFYEALTSWEKKMLKVMGRKQDMAARVVCLREFSDICHTYA